jgi:hypothetical protein
VFHNGEREGKLGTIVTDARLEGRKEVMPNDGPKQSKTIQPSAEPGDHRAGQTSDANFGAGTCGWQVDGDSGVYVTALGDLTEEAK